MRGAEARPVLALGPAVVVDDERNRRALLVAGRQVEERGDLGAVEGLVLDQLGQREAGEVDPLVIGPGELLVAAGAAFFLGFEKVVRRRCRRCARCCAPIPACCRGSRRA